MKLTLIVGFEFPIILENRIELLIKLLTKNFSFANTLKIFHFSLVC